MTGGEFQDRLAARAARAGLAVAPDRADQLEAYFRLLAQWNTRINLTSLPLVPPTDEALDRLLIEPLVAATYAQPANWYDVGSGGGSPAIPFKIAHPRATLTMVESKSRKAAFLREAVRVIELSDASVEVSRFEEVAAAPRRRGTADLITVRAVRPDAALFASTEALLTATGQLLLFQSRDATEELARPFILLQQVPLRTEAGAKLSIIGRMFHVEHPS